MMEQLDLSDNCLQLWATQVFGIDCTGPFGDGILFKGGEWVPGGEYVQRLRVKNVSPKLKKLKYRLPTTKYFSLAYPEVIKLSPGTMQVHNFRLTSSMDGGFAVCKTLEGSSNARRSAQISSVSCRNASTRK